MATLPRIVDYSNFLTLHRFQSTSGGCGGISTLHVFDIQMKRVAPFTPDMSYAFLSYVYNDSMGLHGPRDSNGKITVTRDHRITEHSLDQMGVLKKYGCCSEVEFPSNDDPPNAVFPNEKIPDDANFNHALNYRIKNYTTGKKPDSIEDIKEWLFTHGPLVLGDNEFGHVVALVGYNDFTNKIKYINSVPFEVTEKDYDYFRGRFKNGNATVSWMEIETPPHLEHYTARVSIKGLNDNVGRSAITVRVGVEGKPPVIVWDRNCHLQNATNYTIDNGNNLVIDFPLPAYADEFWPPTKGNWWYAEITDHTTPTTPTYRGMLEDIILVERGYNSEHVPIPILFRPQTTHIPLPAGKTVKVYIPSRKQSKLVLRHEDLMPLFRNEVNFSGILFLEYVTSNLTGPRVIPLANKKIYIDKIISSNSVEQQEVSSHVGIVRTGIDGKFSMKFQVTENARYRATAVENNESLICRSNDIQVNKKIEHVFHN